MIEKISFEEREMINYLRHEYAGAGSGVEFSDLDYILRVWDDEKQTLYKMMGEQLIISQPIKFETPREEMVKQMSKAVREKIYSIIHDLVSSYYHNNCDILDLINHYVLTDNSVPYEFTITLPNGEDLKIKKGMKAIKALGKILTAHGYEKEFEEFRLIHSQILNKKTLTGDLHISIHPLDFMTMSDNNCDWTSCMSWACQGDYRQGTVEMMNSPMVVCAYLTASTPYKISNYEWNNKKWRKLYVVTPEVLLGVRGYPYENPRFDFKVFDILKKLISENLDWGSNYSEPENLYIEDEFTYNGEQYSFQFDTNAMYNDIYDNRWICIADNLLSNRLYINYSGESECMCCGDISYNYKWDEEENQLVCSECANLRKCYRCNDWTNDWVELNDEIYCRYCYENELIECPVCDDRHFNDNEILVFSKRTKKVIAMFSSMCQECIKKREVITIYQKCHNWWNGDSEYRRISAADIDQLSDEELTSLGGKERCETYLNEYAIDFLFPDELPEDSK